MKLVPLTHVDESASKGHCHLFWACVQGWLLEVKRGLDRGLRATGHFRKSVDFFFWKSVAASCPPSLRPTKTPPGSCMTTSGLRFVEYVSLERITGTVLDAGSRLKIWSVP